jgi:deazaflavin-dependent oxidoreductase (nitroreductase family)
MTLDKPPSGTRGARTPPRLLGQIMMPLMLRMHRRSGDRFSGMDLIYLTTVGARSGQSRTTAVARFDDGQGGWFVVASAGGAAQHPAWYHNIAAHPDQVSAEVTGTRHQVRVEQLESDTRDQAWASITAQAPRFSTYLDKTDRQLPVLRLTPTT